TEYGFSEKLGPLRYNNNQEEVFLGHSVSQQKNVSEDTARIIDEEVRRLVDEGMRFAEKILSEKRSDLDAIANALLEFETLSGDEIKGLLRGEPIVRPDADEPPPDRRGRSSVPTSGSRDSKPDEDGAPDLEPEPQSP
ncbi:MAG: cell division protein FtsH, partial [Proteobacteria bacterium]|nr:cell division protein FtsH [Pseudomonadota bacterium]